jgi:23S rRNA (adenine2030-N6)-methyltransferase
MNYRHAFHAGNFADVLKHAVLGLVLRHLALKEKPFRVLDTHAGAGRYALVGGAAERTGEWRDGIGRLFGATAPPLDDPGAAAALEPFLAAVAAENPDGALRHYPGSPLIARYLLRAGDVLVANELHPIDGAALRFLFARDKAVRVLALDGWTALKANLPPKERRGVVLVDPPFEEAGELERLADALAETLARFATGTLLLWYPVKSPGDAEAFEHRLLGKAPGRLLAIELRVRRPTGVGLAGTGLTVLNPPYTLEGDLQRLLPFLVRRLGQGPGAAWRLRHLDR